MKKNQPKQKLLLITAIILLLTSFENIIMATGSYDTTRFYNVMAKARRGEPITIEGNAIGILYNVHNNNTWGKAEFWVDNGKHKIIDAYWTQTWGPATVFCQIAGDLTKGKHILHVKIISDNSNGTGNHYFPLLNILKAGN